MVNDEPFYGNDDFLFVKPNVSSVKRSKPKTRGDYVPQPLEFEVDKEDVEWSKKNIENQIKDTASVLERKTMREGDQVFYTINPKAKPSSFETKRLLERLKAVVIAYLDKTKTKLLVSASANIISQFNERKIPKIILEHIYMIKPLLPDNQIEESLYSEESLKMVIISLMPNINEEQLRRYSSYVFNFLTSKNSKIYFEELSVDGFIIADANIDTIKNLVNDATFIFKIDPIPKATAEKIRTKYRNSTSVAKPLSFNIDTPSLPKIVIMDTGVNVTEQLKHVVIQQSSFSFVNNNDDSPNGHGTPIAYLACFGESSSSPSCKIISSKIYSQALETVAYHGFIESLKKYSDESRLFLTSIGIDGLGDDKIAYLDKLIQKKNVCFVASAGNLEPSQLQDYIRRGLYPQYLSYNAVSPPANATNVVAVGSITKKSNHNSVAPINSVSPHAKCGHGAFPLYECKKPDLVEHGGNVNVDDAFGLNSNQVGVRSINNAGIFQEDFSGSSFASPLFIRKLALIEARYGKRIVNSETLKAISLLSCRPINSNCVGYGEPFEFIGVDFNHAIYVSEGTIPMSDATDKNYTETYHNETMVYIPPSVQEIKLCLTHSDNFQKHVMPTLNTFIDVEVRKSASSSQVEFDTKEARRRKTNIKFLTYGFNVKNMEGVWFFRFIPRETEPIESNDRKNIIVRYGSAILLSRKTKHNYKHSLTEEILRGQTLYRSL